MIKKITLSTFFLVLMCAAALQAQDKLYFSGVCDTD
jgi:hypothetical protein